MHKRKLKPKPTTNMIEVDPKLTSTAVHATVHADLDAISASAEGACSSVGDETSIRMEDEVELELKELREQREDASPSPIVRRGQSAPEDDVVPENDAVPSGPESAAHEPHSVSPLHV